MTLAAAAAAIPLAVPHLGGNESRYVRDCLDQGVVSSVGGYVGRFEREFADAVGAAHAVACASGTAALHLALRLAGAGPGALVATSTLTFVASANAIAYTGADVLLVDSEPATWNLDGERLHDEVVRRAERGRRVPDVVEPVHLLGHPADLEPLLALRDRFGVRVVEDAAEALGARWADGPLDGCGAGTVGDLGCYSFNGNKVMTTGGGGMLVTADARLADRARHLSTQARLPGPGYRHDAVGYNYRLTNLAAALGVAQLEQLPDFLARKAAIARRYARGLVDLPVALPPEAPWAVPSWWLYTVLIDPARATPAAVAADLAAAGVQSRPLWVPLHRQRPYRGAERIGGAIADRIARRGLSLPCSVQLEATQQERVIAALRRALGAGGHG